MKGPRRPSLKTLLDQADVPWTVAEVSWYDGTTRTLELTSQTAVWYRSGKPAVTIRWVLVRDPKGAFDPQALLCTDPSADPTQILEWFVLRWSASGGKSPFRKRAPIWAWRPNASGPTWPSLAPRLSCWASSPGPPWPPTHCSNIIPSPSAPPPGTTTIADLRGCHRTGTPPPVAGVRGFFTVDGQHRYAGTSRHTVPPNGGLPRLRRLNCAKSRQDPARRHFPLALTLLPSVPCYPTPQTQPAIQAREGRPSIHFPTPRTSSPKSAHLPTNTAKTAAKTLPSAPIQPHDPPNALLELAEMRGNEREIDFSVLSPRNYKVPVLDAKGFHAACGEAAGIHGAPRCATARRRNGSML